MRGGGARSLPNWDKLVIKVVAHSSTLAFIIRTIANTVMQQYAVVNAAWAQSMERIGRVMGPEAHNRSELERPSEERIISTTSTTSRTVRAASPTTHTPGLLSTAHISTPGTPQHLAHQSIWRLVHKPLRSLPPKTYSCLFVSAMATASRSRFLISESTLKLSLTPPPSASGTDSVSCTSSTSSHSSSSFAVRRKQFRPTTVPNDQDGPHEARVHSESATSLVSLGIVLVVSGAQPDPYTRRPLKRPHRVIEREPKEKNADGQTKEQPRYKPPPPDVPLTICRRQRPLKLTRTLPLYHPLRPLPPLPSPVDSEPSAPVEQNPATRSSGRTRRPPPRNLEHLIVAVSNTAKQRQGSPAKKRKVVVIAADEMDIDIDAESETGSSKKKTKESGSTSVELSEEPAGDDTDSGSGRAKRAARRNGGKDLSVTPTPPPQEPTASSKTQARASSAQSKKPVSGHGRSAARRVTRRNSDETSSEERIPPNLMWYPRLPHPRPDERVPVGLEESNTTNRSLCPFEHSPSDFQTSNS
ncbi:hypothetical protein RHS01_04040 [Rhizoctonia solani]|uniref:Uncharacterized protein n=1 Tax=Rhizoctonia solani TaxID=456999 RepID=A0A8H7IER6_9AGAM|nr:hypothetical protein RHS01_04040 [Rhizoctonia solani]